MWWFPYFLKKRDIITSSVANRDSKTYHKHDIEVLSSAKHAYELDLRNVIDVWRRSIEK